MVIKYNKIRLVDISIIENLVTVIYHKARNAFLKKNVFSPVLKESSACVALRWSGRLFHKRGAAEQKARSPMVQSFVLGTRRSELFEDLRVQVEVRGVIHSCR